MIMAFGKGKSRSGGGGGLLFYYLNGTNKDRYKKDNRVVLQGNLNTLVKTIDLAHQMGYTETYRNVVLSFSEDYIKKETLKNIVEDFKKQYFVGYSEDEFVFYAEAHLPKIKIKKDANTGELINRKPHIHISFSTYSPKLDKLLSLGNHGIRLKELTTWKEVTEKKYGLKTVKNSALKKDITQIRNTNLLSRKKVIDVCNKVILDNIKNKIFDKHTLKMSLLENIEGIEFIKESTHKAKTPYFSIKMKGANKPIRLKGDLFSGDHIKFMEARKQLLENEVDNKYYEVGIPRKIPFKLQEKLDSYYKSRCLYIEKREAKTRAKLNTVQSELGTIESLNNLPKVHKKELDVNTSPVKTLIRDIQDNVAVSNTNEHYKEYKKTLNPNYLFYVLNTNKNKYTVFKVKNEYRIKCGKRNLNIHDFLIKEIHLSWAEAKVVMDSAYQKQELNQPKISNTLVCYQQKILYSTYKSYIEHNLQSYYIQTNNDTVRITSKEKEVDITDCGNMIIAHGENIKEQVKLMLDIAIAKGWNLSQIEINGDKEFKEESLRQIENKLEEQNAQINDEFDELDVISQKINELNEKLGYQANPKQTNNDINSLPIEDEDSEEQVSKNRKKYR